MAQSFNPANVKSKLGWSNAFDTDGAFPLDVRAWFGSYESAQAAAATAVEIGSTDSKYFYGQQLYVFDGTSAKTYLIQADKSLKEIGSDSTPMKFVASESEMLALTNISVGQEVFREDTKTIWIFKGGDASDVNNWTESASQNDIKWIGTENKVNFYALTRSMYDQITSKDSGTLYFITDEGEIYKGTDVVTTSVLPVSTMPELENAVPGKLYLNTSTLAVKVTFNNNVWYSISPGYLTDGANWADADSGRLATIGLIKKGITESISDKIDKVKDAVENNLSVFNSSGGVKDSNYKIGGATISNSINTVATEQAVLDLMSWKQLS